MAALMRIRVSMNDGSSYEVVAGPKAVVESERHFSKSMTQLFGAESASYEALCFLAWRATQLSNRVVKPFDEWLGDVEGIEPVDESPAPLEIP